MGKKRDIRHLQSYDDPLEALAADIREQEIKNKKLTPFGPTSVDTLHRGNNSKSTSFKKGGAVPDTAPIPTPRSRVDAAEARAKEIGANSPSATVKSMLEGMERYKGKNPPPPRQRGSGGSSTPTGSSYRKGGMVGKTRSSKSHVNWGK
jgi:hypothetical protein